MTGSRMWFISLSLSLVIESVARSKSSYCPVTSQSNFSENFLYPVDIYDCKDATHEAPDFATNNCYSFREATFGTQLIHGHNCSFVYEVKCPIDHSLLVNALKRTKDISPYSPICHLKKKLADPTQVINVYFIGGSVTAGSNSNGCCPTAECACEGLHHCPRCAMPHYLGEYLKATNRATVNWFNLGGHRGMPQDFSGDFGYLVPGTNPNFKGFTSNDVVFLDFSANEGHAGHHWRDNRVARDLQFGAEMLLRKLYRNSVPQSFPTVIYLATAPNKYPEDTHPGENIHFDQWYLELA